LATSSKWRPYLNEKAKNPEIKMDTTTSTPIFQTKEEQIHDLLVAFFNHNMASNKKEGEDDKSERRLTQTQEDMYATE